MLWPQKPVILELNTWPWLRAFGQRCGRPLSLATVPEETLDDLAETGIDLLWLMGVWTRSPGSRSIALGFLPQYRKALPDITPADVIGSPYAVHAWQVAPELGGRTALAELRRRLRERGIGLLLDFVPNHVARDHAWLRSNPDWFIQGNECDLAGRPGDYFALEMPSGRRRIFAHGRDPWFPGWTDTAQLNAFHPGYRRAALELLFDLANQCDGLRCDMAMLLRNEVFANTWRGQLDESAAPDTEFWDALLPALRARHPRFRFIAEVYWGMEAEMLQLGFDYCYDKTLYDALLHSDGERLRALLQVPPEHQQRLLRFTENHDELRAADAFGQRSRAAFALSATLPGALLLYDGQLSGRRIRLPVQLARQPEETPDSALEAFQHRLLRELRAAPFQRGSWRRFDVLPLHEHDASHSALLVHGWAAPGDWRLVAVNPGETTARGRVPLRAWPEIAEGDWELEDLLDSARYSRAGAAMAHQGLGIVLPPQGAHLFRFQRK